MKVKLMFDAEDGKEVVLGLESLPCVGEQFVTGAQETAEVLQVIHTPTNDEHDAIMVLRRV